MLVHAYASVLRIFLAWPHLLQWHTIQGLLIFFFCCSKFKSVRRYIFIPELYLYSFIYLTRHTSQCQAVVCADLAAYQHTCIHERGEEGARSGMNRWMRRRGGGGTLILLCHDLGACLSFYGNKIAAVSADWLSRIRVEARQATARPQKFGESLKSFQRLDSQNPL